MKRLLPAVACGLASMMAYTGTCGADTVTDWDTKATAVASPAALGEREVTIVALAMFDAVNSIERRYQPYLEQFSTTRPTSADAAAASAAATALAGLHPDAAASFKAALAEYLARLDAAPEALSNGVRLGENFLPFVPFAFDVTAHIRRDAGNSVCCLVAGQNYNIPFIFDNMNRLALDLPNHLMEFSRREGNLPVPEDLRFVVRYETDLAVRRHDCDPVLTCPEQ